MVFLVSFMSARPEQFLHQQAWKIAQPHDATAPEAVTGAFDALYLASQMSTTSLAHSYRMEVIIIVGTRKRHQAVVKETDTRSMRSASLTIGSATVTGKLAGPSLLSEVRR